jgi:hypothetical protein
MGKGTQKTQSTTQKFTQIEDILGEVALFSGSQAALVLEVTATNFALQSQDEQQSRIYSYAALLNSLSFPIQVLIVSRKLDISNYLKLLEVEAKKTTSQSLSNQINQYRDFVSQLVRENTVLDKKFYLILSFSILEKGAKGVAESKNKQAFFNEARTELNSKANSIKQELLRVGLKSRTLEREELLNLFYGIYNPDGGRAHDGMTSSLVKGGK